LFKPHPDEPEQTGGFGTGGKATGGVRATGGAASAHGGVRATGGAASAHGGSGGASSGAISTSGGSAGFGGTSSGGASGSGGSVASGTGGRGGVLPEVSCAKRDDGSYCENATQFTCLDGAMDMRASCGTNLGCNSERTACGTPGAFGGRTAETSGGLSACASFDPGTCGDCLDTSCCDQGQACAKSGSCTALWQCLIGCSDLFCKHICLVLNPEGVAIDTALRACMRDKCNDKCSEGDPCSIVVGTADGCGPNLGLPEEPSRLFHCSGGRTVSSLTCANGCYAAPEGVPDRCL
jgi:hypothetical protein